MLQFSVEHHQQRLQNQSTFHDVFQAGMFTVLSPDILFLFDLSCEPEMAHCVL